MLLQQVEGILYQVTELTTTSRQEEECLHELVGIVPIIASLLVSLLISTSFSYNIILKILYTKKKFLTV